jgi:class 3 adenylate cyclase/tetratricopeptide (TPR) repeat protein
VSEIRAWLDGIGLAQYAGAFESNDIDMDLLGRVDDQTLKDIGVSSAGHRLRIRDAIATLTPLSPLGKNESALAAGTDKGPAFAERRQVTVLFSDLVGSTALSARMDPEDLRDIISAYQKCVADTVGRFAGFVAKYMGDGVLVYFGYPQAHEDDGERAVRTGLELIQAVGTLKAASPLQTRIGIATGLVVVGDLIGSGEAQEHGIVGETPNLAARLQGVAEPNTVVIADSTRKLLGSLFELQDLGGKDLKGIAEPVRAWAALHASSIESRFEALRTATTPLVGREEEVDLLLRRWEQAKRGDGCVVLISGEPGIGKSRLAQTIVERLAGEPHIRLRFFCLPHHQDSALYPIIAHLERAASFHRDDTAEQRLEKLEAMLARGTNDLAAVAPLIADLLSVPLGDRYPSLDLTPQKRKEKTLAALASQVEELSTREPVLMVYEDVHWSDPTTRESLDLLLDRLSARRVLAIITFRPEYAPPWLGRPNVTMLTLNRLASRHRTEIIRHVVGGKALPKEIAEQIADRTDGVPLFIEELTKSVVESGLVTEVGDRYAVTMPAAPLAIPTTLHASLLARLDRLAPTREVAQIGAALGRSFSHELIAAVAQMPQQKLNEALEQLVAAELIFRRGTSPDAEYTFKHALVQDAAYSTLLRSRRQQIHSRIASVLETQFPEIVATQSTILAQHCTAGGLYEKAAEYWLKAGRQAFVRSAMVEALTSLRKGLDQLIKLPEGPTRQQYELDLLIALGPALIATKGYSASEVGETLARASGLADRLNRTDHLVALLYGHFAYHVVRAEYALALSFAEQLERIGIGHNDPASQLMAREGRGAVCVCRGEFQAARALFESSGEPHLPRALYASVSVDDVYMVRQSRLGFTLACLGLLDQSRLQAREALLDARRLEHVYTLGHVLINVCHVEWLIGSPIGDQWHATEVISLAEEHGFPYWSSWGLLHRGRSVVARDSTEDAIAMMQEGLSIMRASGGSLLSTWVLTMLAEAYAKLGRPVEALKAIAEAFLVVDATDERIGEAELHRLRGDLLNVTGDPAAAERDYHLALAIAGKQSAKLFELRAATSLARLWLDQGKRKEACELITPVYGWFTEGFDTRDLKEAKTLLDELAA